MPRKALFHVMGLVLTMSLAQLAGADPGPSGQAAFGQVTVEPAYDDMTGDLIYLLTPDHAPFPSRANSRATAPMYLVMYPQGSTVTPLNCLPTNCDHVEVLPSGLVEGLGLQSVYPIGTISTKYGSFTGGLVLGHDHLVGVAQTHGDFNVAWDVDLVLFTPQGVDDGAINQPLRTLAAVNAAIANGDAAGPIDAGIVFNCSVTSEATYKQGHFSASAGSIMVNSISAGSMQSDSAAPTEVTTWGCVKALY
jgi:hypothetical protein